MDFLAPYRPQLLSILRIATALFFLEHPSSKFLGFPHIAYFDHLSPLSWPVGIAGIVETIFGILLLIGLWSRLAAFILSGEMACAYFMFHVPMGMPQHGILPILNGGEPAVLYCFTFLFLAAAGAGPWSVDAMSGREKA
ncbi:MAG TPA: DoxX family protein [Stellaceae bacterium]|jgi:putative oxidoreductase|nr:DoxX family protein [Stellaceae bacterium]